MSMVICFIARQRIDDRSEFGKRFEQRSNRLSSTATSNRTKYDSENDSALRTMGFPGRGEAVHDRGGLAPVPRAELAEYV
jgi:hypothetical protein